MAARIGFSGFSTVEPPQTAGVTDNPRPRPLSREQPIGIGTGGKDPGPGGHPGGPMGRRRRPVSWGGTRRGVLRFRLPLGAPLARHAPPSPTARGGTRREVSRFRLPCGTPLARHAPPSPTEDGRVCGPGGCVEGQGLNSTLTTELSSGGRAALVRSMAIGLLKRAHSTPSRGSHSPWGRRQSESYCSSQHNSRPKQLNFNIRAELGEM